MWRRDECVAKVVGLVGIVTESTNNPGLTLNPVCSGKPQGFISRVVVLSGEPAWLFVGLTAQNKPLGFVSVFRVNPNWMEGSLNQLKVNLNTELNNNQAVQR